MILFCILLVFAFLSVVGFFAFISDDCDSSFLILALAAIFVLMSIYIPIQRTEDFPINKPEIVFNSNGAIVVFEKSNYTFNEFAEVECLKNGTMVPVNQKKYNFYDCVVSSDVVLKPLDSPTKN